MRPDNPYAAPIETGLSPAEDFRRDVVSFGGVHCSADCWMSFRTTNFVRHLWHLGTDYWAMGIVLVGGTWAAADHLIHGNRVWPVWFFGLAALSLYPWLWAWHWCRAYRHARKESKDRYFREGSKFLGFLDKTGIVACSKRGTSRAPWSELLLSSADPDRLEVQFKSFEHLWRLPSRFFASAEDYLDARRLTLHQLFSNEYEPGKRELEKLPYRNEPGLSQDQIEMARQWDADHWPFFAGRQRISFEYQPTLPQSPVMEVLRTWVLHWLITVFPVVLSIPIWLTADRLYFADWRFLSDNHLANLFYVVPTTGLLISYAVRFRREYKSSQDLMLKPIRLVASETGFYLRQGDYSYWSSWAPSLEVISTDTTTGWRDDDDDEPHFLFDRERLGNENSSALEKLLRQVADELAAVGSLDNPQHERFPHVWSQDS